MEKSLVQKLRLGIFVLVGLTLFVLTIWLIGSKQNLIGNSSDLYAVFNNVNGLKTGNNIRFSGIKVGTVKSIQMINDTFIVVKMSVESDITKHIKTDAKAVITTDGLVGNMIVNILPGAGSQTALQSGDTIRSYSRIRTDEMLNTLSVTNENAALLTAELLKITKEISNGKGIVGAIIKDSTITEDVKQTLHFLRKTSFESSIAIKNINGLVLSLDKKGNLLGTIRDTALANQIKHIVTNIEKSSQEIESVINHLNTTIENTNNTILNVKEGKGAINYLSNDATLVKKIDHTVSNLDSALIKINTAGIKLNENLEALKHNWLLRGYFKNLEKEKEKSKKK
jgi:phospholipid/cholesterol/gamma-HCH transport system substrate-binding protein